MKERLHLARRMAEIEPFHVMELLGRARALEAAGRSIIHMEVGEPDFTTPEPVIAAAQAALVAGHTHYTPATGLPELRQAIADFYRRREGVEVDPARIVITPGASGALLLALGVILDAGERVMMADPGYPCNRHFARFLEGQAQSVAVDEASGFQLMAGHIDDNWDRDTVAALVASPSNPTGTVLERQALSDVIAAVQRHNGVLLVDEIYHSLIYEGDAPSALALSDEVFVINSFSKYFCMTGWRLGWLVVPEGYRRAVEKLMQNLFIAAPTLAQYAALAALKPDSLEILERQRLAFAERRDYLLPALRELGFHIPVTPQGAFYLYADTSAFSNDSMALANHWLEELGVAVTPGLDFGSYQAEHHVRFAYTTALEKLQEGVRRLRGWVETQ